VLISIRIIAQKNIPIRTFYFLYIAVFSKLFYYQEVFPGSLFEEYKLHFKVTVLYPIVIFFSKIAVFYIFLRIQHIFIFYLVLGNECILKLKKLGLMTSQGYKI